MLTTLLRQNLALWCFVIAIPSVRRTTSELRHSSVGGSFSRSGRSPHRPDYSLAGRRPSLHSDFAKDDLIALRLFLRFLLDRSALAEQTVPSSAKSGGVQPGLTAKAATFLQLLCGEAKVR